MPTGQQSTPRRLTYSYSGREFPSRQVRPFFAGGIDRSTSHYTTDTNWLFEASNFSIGVTSYTVIFPDEPSNSYPSLSVANYLRGRTFNITLPVTYTAFRRDASPTSTYNGPWYSRLVVRIADMRDPADLHGTTRHLAAISQPAIVITPESLPQTINYSINLSPLPESVLTQLITWDLRPYLFVSLPSENGELPETYPFISGTYAAHTYRPSMVTPPPTPPPGQETDPPPLPSEPSGSLEVSTFTTYDQWVSDAVTPAHGACDPEYISPSTAAEPANLPTDPVKFEARAMKRSDFKEDDFQKKTNITLTFAGNDTFARQWLIPDAPDLTVDVYSYSPDLTTLTPVYRGKLATVKYTPEQTVGMVFEPRFILQYGFVGERRMFQRNCPYMIYGQNCGVDITRTVRIAGEVLTVVSPKSFRVRIRSSDQQITTITGQRVSIGFLIGGVVETADSRFWITNIINIRASGAYTEGEVVLLSAHGLAVGDDVYLKMGCHRNTAACKDVHNNLPRYGGFPSMVKISPFNGGIAPISKGDQLGETIPGWAFDYDPTLDETFTFIPPNPEPETEQQQPTDGGTGGGAEPSTNTSSNVKQKKGEGFWEKTGDVISDAAEWVADTVSDAVEWVVDTATDAIDVVTETVSDGWDAVVEWWNS